MSDPSGIRDTPLTGIKSYLVNEGFVKAIFQEFKEGEYKLFLKALKETQEKEEIKILSQKICTFLEIFFDFQFEEYISKLISEIQRIFKSFNLLKVY